LQLDKVPEQMELKFAAVEPEEVEAVLEVVLK
jgi:hypothetical protein